MPLDIFIGKDKWNTPVEFHTSREFLASKEICAKLWDYYNNHSDYAVIIVNSQGLYNEPHIEPDMIIITQYGLGILEIKDKAGSLRIEQEGNRLKWYTDLSEIPIQTKNGLNPQEQVQSYASIIRGALLDLEKKWLPKYSQPIEAYKFDTGVYFSHPFSDLSVIRTQLLDYYPRDRILRIKFNKMRYQKKWEHFAVLEFDDILDWVLQMRFQIRKGRKDGFVTYKLSQSEIQKLSNQFFNVVPWESMLKLLKEGIPPYGYLELGSESLSVRLTRQIMTIGRSRDCQVKIPNIEKYKKRVHGVHARIIYIDDEIFVDNIGVNGTYVNGEKISKPEKIENGQIFTLGGRKEEEGICELRYISEFSDPTLRTG